MDADLQDPPEVVLEMVKKWREGFDVVFAARKARGETWFKLLRPLVLRGFARCCASIHSRGCRETFAS